MDPYAWGLIGVSALAILLTVIAVLQKRQLTALTPPSGASGNLSPSLNIFLDGISKLVSYTPYTLTMFGFIRDIIYEDFRYSTVSLTGIASVLVNALIGFIGVKYAYRESVPMSGGGDEVYSMFQYLDSCFSPQLLVLSASMITFLFIDFGTSRDINQNIGLFVASGAFLILQGIFMGIDGSFSKYYYAQQEMTGSSVITWVVGILVGAGLGGLGYLTTYYVNQSVLPSRENATTNLQPTSPGVMKSTGPPEKIIQVGEKSSVDQSLPVNDQDQFVCEAYKDGELVTSTIVE